ncbi:MAG TPA: hypothetical protein ENH62_09005 [Marinobacter sp.]|nr:hypothetical protein [Marinobacter sp.]
MILAVLLWTAPAQAQAACDARAKIITRLAENYQEQPRGRGVTARSLLMELFISPEGTWTLLVSQPNGISCLIAAGDGWLEIPYIPDGPREKI